ncbi:Protein angel 1 [Desmophyllum pertusum]|uniref:Protein angel 1 n=1 Tax=Desmophyllum pertusum TaxID=174260 RepID=A0A9X0A5B7_9CNID|nr:Protein angel 1 [Desmophyllum pertusum]
MLLLLYFWKPRVSGHASRHSNSLLCVSNTHLLFNKKRGDIKLAQLACLFAEIEELARISSPGKTDPCYHPIICCGDFNSTPFSPIYDFVSARFSGLQWHAS